MTRRIITLVVTILTALSALTTVDAASKIKEVEYDGKGVVEVEFDGKVTYSNPKVTVKDASGKAYSATIIEKDDDDLEFKVANIASGTNYTFTISGIKFMGSSGYTSVSGTFKTPASKTTATTNKPTTTTSAKVTALTIKEVEYDLKDKELEIDFNSKVQYKNPKVTVQDSNGKTFEAKIYSKDDDDLEAIVFGLQKGKTYKVTVSGVAKRGTTGYTTVTATLKVGNGKVASMANTNVERFVERSYRLCLGRNPEQAGLNYWTKRLNNRQETAASAVQGFFESKEFKQMNLSNAEYVERCYNIIMDRQSDKAGKAYWMNKLVSGMSKKELLRNFINSTEFSNILKDYNIAKGDIR